MAQHDRRLANRILFGLAFGAVAGALVLLTGGMFPGLPAGARWLSRNIFDPLGQVFLRTLFFVVIPLVFASLAFLAIVGASSFASADEPLNGSGPETCTVEAFQKDSCECVTCRAPHPKPASGREK